MLQNACKTLGFKKNTVYKIPPGGEVNHIQPVAYLGCLPVRGDNPRALASELSYVQVEKHSKTF